MAGLSKPQVNEGDLDLGLLNEVNDVMAKSCQVFIAKGVFNESDIPTTKTELAELYGASGKFVYFGNMASSGSNITWEPHKIKIDFHEIQTYIDVKGTLESVSVSKKMLDFLDSQTGLHSFLFVPKGDSETFFALSGVMLAHNGNLTVVGEEISKVTISATRRVNLLKEVIKLDKLTT